jgi:hypothetical protein
MGSDAHTQTAGRWLTRLRDHLVWRWGRVRRMPGLLVNLWFGNLWHDHWLRRQVLITEGALEATRRCAVYVMYPRLGLQDSHLASLAYLARKGFAPLVVSNLPLTPQERERLQPLCWRLVERPNYGYDFGAYREGVLMALDQLPGLDQLSLVNDSTWFPVPASADWLAQAERLEVDLAGAVSNDGWLDYLADPGRGRPWAQDEGTPHLHYCSFALLFGARILKDPGFRTFWQGLTLTADKLETIRRGEVGLSRWVIDRGYRHAQTLDLTRFDQHLERMDADQLRELAANLVIPEDEALRKEQQALVGPSAAPADAATLRRFILWATAATGPAYALPHWSLPEQGFGFLKKSPMWLSRPTAQITTSLIERHGDASMLEEARRLAGGAKG